MVKIGKKPVKPFLVVWLVNLVVIYFVSFLYPEDIVLGNAALPNWVALLIVSVILTLVFYKIPLIIKTLKLKLSNKWLLGITHGLINIIILWVVARIAYFSGFGISSVLVAVTLGTVLTILQYGTKQMLMGK